MVEMKGEEDEWKDRKVDDESDGGERRRRAILIFRVDVFGVCELSE